MRTLISLVFILVIASCTSYGKDKISDRVIIAGKIVNPDVKENKIEFSINRIVIGKERISSTVDKNGEFKIIFESYVPLDVWLNYKSMGYLVLTHPGDSINVNFDGNANQTAEFFKTIAYSGDASRLNTEATAFQFKYLSSSLYDDDNRNMNAIRSLDEVQYKTFRDSLRNEEQNLLNEFIIQNNPLTETVKWAKIYLDVNYYGDLVSYPDFHRMANNLKRTDWKVPVSYYDFLNDHVPFNDSILISSYSLSRFANFYPVYLLEKARDENRNLFSSENYFKTNPGVLDSLRIFGAIRYTHDPLLKEMVLTEMLRQDLDQSNTRMFKNYEQIISELINEPYLKEPLFDLYRQTTNNLENPTQASDAILHKLRGNSIETEINRIIEINKGKVVYIDCWATWCGPCIAELPNSNKLMKLYKSEEVAFIFICLDSEEKNWKAVLSKYSLAGQHYFLSKNQSSEFRNAFNIKGVPHYILIDKHGDIFENGTQSPSFIKAKLDRLVTE